MQQQGSLDWVALSKTIVGSSIDALTRFTSARVDLSTVTTGQTLFAQFRLPGDAQRRLEVSVSKLKAYPTAADALWFGIGFKHPIRSLMETEQGAALVAVSSCLMVSYDCEFSAKVLKALCDQSSMSDRPTPALSQWSSLMSLCAPAVMASQFPILVEGYSRLLMSNADKQRGSGAAVTTSPSELAAALLEIAHLSTGKVAQLPLVANADCGWLVALAEWLFSLRVEVVDGTGTSLYQSKGSRPQDIGSFHLTIICLKDGETGDRQTLLRNQTRPVTPGKLDITARWRKFYHSFYQGRSE